MDTIIIYPQNKEQLNALKVFIKAMGIPFDQKKEVYPAHVLNGIKQSLKEVEEGKLTPFTGIVDMLNS